jgi:hypothetical protein
MGFFQKNKLLTLLILLAVAYWFLNPPHKFGFSHVNIVVFDRMPIPLFDLYVDLSGKKYPLENINKAAVFEQLCGKLGELSGKNSSEQPTLIVGTGFSLRPLFSLQSKEGLPQSLRWINIVEMSSSAAMREYNLLVDRKKPVAIVLKIRDH